MRRPKAWYDRPRRSRSRSARRPRGRPCTSSSCRGRCRWSLPWGVGSPWFQRKKSKSQYGRSSAGRKGRRHPQPIVTCSQSGATSSSASTVAVSIARTAADLVGDAVAGVDDVVPIAPRHGAAAGERDRVTERRTADPDAAASTLSPSPGTPSSATPLSVTETPAGARLSRRPTAEDVRARPARLRHLRRGRRFRPRPRLGMLRSMLAGSETTSSPSPASTWTTAHRAGRWG